MSDRTVEIAYVEARVRLLDVGDEVVEASAVPVLKALSVRSYNH